MAAIAAAAKEMGSVRGEVDAYFDISPPHAGASPHIKAGVMSLRQYGRMSLMGGAAGDVGFLYFTIMRKGLTLRGTFMAKAGAECVGVYGLEEWEEAFRVAGEEGRMGRFCAFDA
ncbi:hypothetical protein GE09DRAFT_1210848 [Coniochaeta sp. 2T2.1]|nr:hypothetical protein GE09DRAFT_1210848 [Coniochaeta sp. 2T2.1]